DDAINVSSNLGWPLDGSGNLHPSEKNYVETVVNRFEHHKHIIWVVMEEVQEMGSDYVAHAKKIAAAVKQADDHDHVVAVHQLPGLSFSNFADDPNIDQFAIQDLQDTASSLHSDMITAWNNAAGRYNLNMAEAFTNTTDYFGTGESARKKLWAVAMGGGYGMAIGWDIKNTPVTTLEDAGRLVEFMESTSFNEMAPHDELAFGGTQYVLANPGQSYIAYASALSGNIGLKGMTAGSYDFTWFDATSGATVVQSGVSVSAGDRTWGKPAGIGNELAVYIKRVDGSTPAPSPSYVWPNETTWLTATPESQGMSSSLLASATNKVTTSIGTAIVIRNGYDVWHYGDPYAKTDGWWASAMRSYLTTLFGMLIHQGVIPGGEAAVEMRVNDLPSQTAQGFGDSTKLKHLLSYTSCSSPPGSGWSYGCNYPKIEAIFTEITGITPWDYINSELEPTLGGKSWRGIENHSDSDLLRVVGPEADMARWGYLWLRNGRWKDQQVLDPWFVQMASDPLLKPDGSGFADNNEGWQIHTNDGGKWAGLPRDSYAALGARAQAVIFVAPSLDLVVSRLGQEMNQIDHIEEFLKPIVDAVIADVTPDITPPTAPGALTASAASQSRINLSWTPAADAESGVASYNIYRNGTKVGSTASTSYGDTGLTGGTAYSYQVSATNGVGMEGPKSNTANASTLVDNVAPTIAGLSMSSPTTLVVTFSEPVQQASATSVGNYAISNGVTINAASLSADKMTVALTTSAHSEGVAYTLTVNSVKDLAATPNTIASNTQREYTYVPGPVQVSNLTVASNKAYTPVEGGLTNGAGVFIDRPYTITTVPPSVGGATYIKASNDDKVMTNDVLMTFAINQDADVYVGFDSRATSLPSWLSGWQDAGQSLVTTDATHRLYKKAFPAGSISLGATNAAGAAFSGMSFSSYVVAFVGSGAGNGDEIPVNQPPVASFTATPISGEAPLAVSFNASASTDDAQIVSYSWDFGDGSSVQGVQASHTYSAAGSYTTKLTVTDDAGEQHSASRTITVTAPAPEPQAVSLTVGSAQVAVGQSATIPVVLSAAPSGVAGFDISVSLSNANTRLANAQLAPEFSAPESGISADLKRLTGADFQNAVQSGATSITLATLTVEGILDGATSVSVTVNILDDDQGNPMSASVQNGTVTVPNNTPVVAPIADVAIELGQPLAVSGAFTDAGDASGWSATVNYGDGSGTQALALNGTSFSLSRVYISLGEYQVTVSVTDNNGAKGTTSFDVLVSSPRPKLPGVSGPVEDWDGDGLAEDMNGNGRLDFADIVLFFENVADAIVQGNWEYFDFNRNGRVDMADIRAMFMLLVS
ncbi:MAG: PKD domain-containing protein, partial [Chloroflexi bacterium]|nr:PKD domain-containing protein [Chloroflexota bacterium]